MIDLHTLSLGTIIEVENNSLELIKYLNPWTGGKAYVFSTTQRDEFKVDLTYPMLDPNSDLTVRCSVVSLWCGYYNEEGAYLVHREDGPAVIHSNGGEVYYLHGEFHREDGPAEIHPDGYKVYFFHGKRHREDGPAAIHPDGGELYYLHGELHREDGPAVIYPSGYKAYWFHGKRHREDGPAVIYSSGREAYYLHDKLLTKEQWERRK